MPVTRTTSGLGLYHDFEAFTLGSVAGQFGWTERLGAGPPNHDMDLGTGTIVAGKYLQLSSGNFHRRHNESFTALNVVVEARSRITVAGGWTGLRWGLQSGVTNTDYEAVFKSASTDGLYRSNASSPILVKVWPTAAPTLTLNTWYRFKI